MDNSTLMALRGSIAKWEKIVAGAGSDNGQHDCPLCAMFIHKRCQGCPVQMATGLSSCRNTPYANEWLVVMHHRVEKSINVFTNLTLRQRAREAAMSELAFLRSLLPVEHPAPEAKPESNPFESATDIFTLEQKLQAALPPDAGKIALMIMHKDTLLVTTASGNAYAWDEATKTMSHIQPIADQA